MLEAMQCGKKGVNDVDCVKNDDNAFYWPLYAIVAVNCVFRCKKICTTMGMIIYQDN